MLVIDERVADCPDLQGAYFDGSAGTRRKRHVGLGCHARSSTFGFESTDSMKPERVIGKQCRVVRR
jgi:hypothetical protein